jgi:hypothetical protein
MIRNTGGPCQVKGFPESLIQRNGPSVTLHGKWHHSLHIIWHHRSTGSRQAVPIDRLSLTASTTEARSLRKCD